LEQWPPEQALSARGFLRQSEGMAGIRYEFEADLWRWEARRDLWVFVRLPLDISEEIRDQPHPPAGFGSVKVVATLGSSRWSTSIFPESADGSYTLAIKGSVRKKEGVGLGDVVRIGIETLL
jgi:hypothetical protein